MLIFGPQVYKHVFGAPGLDIELDAVDSKKLEHGWFMLRFLVCLVWGERTVMFQPSGIY